MMISEPKRGWRDILVKERRTRIEFGCCMRPIVDLHPEAESIRVVLDNLNTHKHGSWLKIVEIELAVLSKCCLSKRLYPRAPS